MTDRLHGRWRTDFTDDGGLTSKDTEPAREQPNADHAQKPQYDRPSGVLSDPTAEALSDADADERGQGRQYRPDGNGHVGVEPERRRGPDPESVDPDEH